MTWTREWSGGASGIVPGAAADRLARHRRSGFTLMEVVIALALFGIFMYVFAQLTLEMRGYEKKMPVNLLAHPQVGLVVERLRRDVLDATPPYYPDAYDIYKQTPKTLIVDSLQESGFVQHIVWDFSKKGEATRRAFSSGTLSSEWTARGVPQFQVSDFPIDGHPDSVRLIAVDKQGDLSVDQIFQPRTHE